MLCQPHQASASSCPRRQQLLDLITTLFSSVLQPLAAISTSTPALGIDATHHTAWPRTRRKRCVCLSPVNFKSSQPFASLLNPPRGLHRRPSRLPQLVRLTLTMTTMQMTTSRPHQPPLLPLPRPPSNRLSPPSASRTTRLPHPSRRDPRVLRRRPSRRSSKPSRAWTRKSSRQSWWRAEARWNRLLMPC